MLKYKTKLGRSMLNFFLYSETFDITVLIVFIINATTIALLKKRTDIKKEKKSLSNI